MNLLDLVGLFAWCGAFGLSLAAVTALLRWCPHPLVAALQGCAATLVPLGALSAAIMALLGQPGAGALAGCASLVWYIDLRRITSQRATHPELSGQHRQHDTSAGDTLRLLSTNLLLVNPTPDSCAATVHAQQADVVVTLETTSTLADRLDHHMMTAYGPVRMVGTGPRGSMAAIRVKRDIEVVRAGRVRVGVDELPEVVVRHAGHEVRIVGVHLHAPVRRAHLAAWRDELDALHQLAREATACGQRLMLAGDFNASSAHPGLRKLLATVRDALIDRNRHLVATWTARRGVLPLMGIDHVLTTGGLCCPGVRLLAIPGSDHRGLLVDVATTMPAPSAS